MRKFFLGLLILAIFNSSCSKDSPEEEIPEEQTCEMESVDEGCEVAYLEGTNNWLKIIKQGNLADPRFMYPLGVTDDPYGTVTVFIENGNPVIYINDMVLNDYVLRISESPDGSGAICKAENNIETPDTADESADIIKIDHQVSFPFYIQLQTNTCF